MHRHSFFADIFLHSDDELAEVFTASILSRETIHQWPLSCVQRVELEGGRVLAYKTQLPPTVEHHFYANVSSPLLAGHRLLQEINKCQTMAIEWIEYPLLRELAPFVEPAIISIFWFLRLHWAVEAQFDLLPNFSGSLFDYWTSNALKNILTPGAAG